MLRALLAREKKRNGPAVPALLTRAPTPPPPSRPPPFPPSTRPAPPTRLPPPPPTPTPARPQYRTRAVAHLLIEHLRHLRSLQFNPTLEARIVLRVAWTILILTEEVNNVYGYEGDLRSREEKKKIMSDWAHAILENFDHSRRETVGSGATRWREGEAKGSVEREFGDRLRHRVHTVIGPYLEAINIHHDRPWRDARNERQYSNDVAEMMDRYRNSARDRRNSDREERELSFSSTVVDYRNGAREEEELSDFSSTVVEFHLYSEELANGNKDGKGEGDEEEEEEEEEEMFTEAFWRFTGAEEKQEEGEKKDEDEDEEEEEVEERFSVALCLFGGAEEEDGDGDEEEEYEAEDEDEEEDHDEDEEEDHDDDDEDNEERLQDFFWRFGDDSAFEPTEPTESDAYSSSLEPFSIFMDDFPPEEEEQ